jgi:hypothetical protein
LLRSVLEDLTMPHSRLIGILTLAGTLAAGSAFAHHEPAALGTVRITQPVMAGGTVLQPGTYDVRDTGEHVMPLPGQSEDAQTRIEFIQNGTVVGRDVAEVMTPEGGSAAVGTSGGSARIKVEALKGGDFVRLSTVRNGERLLIHLPVAH